MIKTLIATFLAVNLFANTSYSLENLKFEKINENVYVIHGPEEEPNKNNKGFMNNPGAIIGESGVIIIDPGGSRFGGELILRELKEITNKPIVAIFNTHVHGDHWLANTVLKEAYPKAKIYAHPQMIKRAKNGDAKMWLDMVNHLSGGINKDMNITYPTIATKNMQAINIGNQTFIIHTPFQKSHTNTDIMVEHVQSKTMFLGDNDYLGRFGNFDSSSSIYGNIKALEFAISKKMKVYVPGHGQSGDAKKSVYPFLNYMKNLEKIVKAGYDEDMESFEIKKQVQKKLSRYKTWDKFLTNTGKHTTKMYNEIEALDM